MPPSEAEAMRGDNSSLGLERWRSDDLAAWLKGGLIDDAAAQPQPRVWRAIERELSSAPAARSGLGRLHHAYASLGSAVAMAYVLSFGALFLAQRAAGAAGACAADCQWDGLSEAETARQAGLGYLGADAHPGWTFRLPPPPMDRDILRAERYERRLREEWGEAAPQPAPGMDAAVVGGIEMD